MDALILGLGAFLLISYAIMQTYLTWLLCRSTWASAPTLSVPLPVLMATRNEEPYLPQTLDSLAKQSLPLHWVGVDDGSVDATPQIWSQWAHHHPKRVTWMRLQEGQRRAPGKLGALLAAEEILPRAPYFLVADADMLFPASWAEGLVAVLESNPALGGVCAPSLPRERTLWEAFQRIETAATLYLIAASQSRGQIVTAIGNSLALRWVAWQSIGGWRSLPPTLVEDYALLVALQQAGWRFQWVWHPAVLGETRAEPTFGRWHQQRLRWRQAVGQVTGLSLFYWSVQSLVPWVVLFLWQGWAWGVFLAAELLPLWRWRQITGARRVLRYLPLLGAYRFLQGAWLVYLYFARSPIRWKGRQYAP